MSILSSHRIRTEEKKLYRKFTLTVLFLITTAILLLFAGLPLLAKIIIGVSSIGQNKNNPSRISVNETLLFAPILDPLPEATNSSKIKISGFGEKDSIVIINLNNNTQIKVKTENDGHFETQNIKLEEGANSITAINLNDEKESSPSSPVSIIYKQTPPKLDLESPSDGQKFFSEDKVVSIKGETDLDNTVSINDRFAIVDKNGQFSYTTRLSDGENAFTIIAQDQAGNQSKIERKVTYVP